MNYLGPYLLTRLLEPALVAAAPAARVVNLSSVMSRLGSMPSNPRDYLVSEAAGMPLPPLLSRMHALAAAVSIRSRAGGPMRLRLQRVCIPLARFRLPAAVALSLVSHTRSRKLLVNHGQFEIAGVRAGCHWRRRGELRSLQTCQCALHV